MQEQLEDLFSDIGPVKQAFMVNDRESAAPRGFAFVKLYVPVRSCSGAQTNARDLRRATTIAGRRCMSP